MREYEYLESILLEDPFSLEFDVEKLKNFREDQNIDDKNKDLISFMFFCRNIHIQCYSVFIEVFKLLQLSKEEAIRFVYVVANYSHSEITKMYYQQLENKKEKKNIFNLESAVFEKIDFENGVNISLSQGLEKGGDVISILISFLNSFGNSLIGGKSLIEYSNDFLIEKSNKLWYHANQYYAFASYFDIIKYQNGIVIIEESGKVIKIKKSKENLRLSTLEVVGEIRDLNIYNEYSLGLKYAVRANKKEKGLTSIKISKGIVLPEVGLKNTKDSFVGVNVLLLKIGNVFSKDDYGGLNSIEIIKIFSLISELANEILRETLTKKIDIKDTPYLINKTLLIEKINSVTNIDKLKINTVLNSIIDKNITPYFWRRPLYEYNSNLYLSFSLLIAPNYQLLLESYIDSLKLDLKNKQVKFKNYILSELSDLKYCKVVNSEEFVNIIILELRDYYLMINIFYASEFPIEANENYCYLKEISSEIINIEINRQKLGINSTKNYVPLILTNYNKYSGLVLNDIPLFDIVLLKNYLITGAFQKGQIIRNNKSLKSEVFNGYTYYEDEDDFNGNLLNFLYNPIPVFEIKNKIFWFENAILPVDSKVQIYIDNYDYKDNDGTIEYELSSLADTLQHQYLGNPEGKLNDLANKTILFRITNIFHYLTFSKYELTSYRHQLIKLFSDVNINGYAHLLHYFRISLRYLENVQLKKNKRIRLNEYNEEVVFSNLKKIFDKSTKISVSSLDFDHKFSKKEEKEIISFAIDVISNLTIKKYELKEIENYLLMLSVLGYYKTKYNLNNYFYLGASNIISALNHNFLYQQARNLAEDFFAMAIKERNEHKGWGVLFMNADQQKNQFNAIIYSCFYLNSLSVVDKMPYAEAIDVFFNILKFSRSLKLSEILDDVFNFLKSLKLEEYDFQKIHLAYYLSIVDRKQNDRTKILKDSMAFFTENKQLIFKYQDKGTIPWLNYFYNLKRLDKDGFLSVNVDHILEEIEKNLSIDIVLSIKGRHFYNSESKANFIKNLKRVFGTYYVSDFVSEITNLELDSNLIIENSIKENDLESILLTGLVNNDIRLIYKENNEVNEIVEFTIDNTHYYEIFDKYLDYILNLIIVKSKQLFIYLFSNNGKVYYLKINDKKEISIKEIDGWKSDNNFLKNKEKFYYNGANFFGIEDQESHYRKLLDELQYTSMGIDDEYEELIITTNLELSKNPLNLIVNKDDFIGATKPITNGLLLEWFIENSKDLVIEDLSINLWIPIDDDDPTLSLGYEKIKPVLDEFNINTITTSIPNQPLDKIINIFFAHGELDNIGFKAISLNDEKFILNKEKLFGKGKIAILFICHSGSVNEDFFSNRVQSLIYDLIQIGYESVIAPFWALEVTIPGFWLKSFLNSFKEGFKISECVFLANSDLANYHEAISGSFFVPEGRLAMHIYGNPNIKMR